MPKNHPKTYTKPPTGGAETGEHFTEMIFYIFFIVI